MERSPWNISYFFPSWDSGFWGEDPFPLPPAMAGRAALPQPCAFTISDPAETSSHKGNRDEKYLCKRWSCPSSGTRRFSRRVGIPFSSRGMLAGPGQHRLGHVLGENVSLAFWGSRQEPARLGARVRARGAFSRLPPLREGQGLPKNDLAGTRWPDTDPAPGRARCLLSTLRTPVQTPVLVPPCLSPTGDVSLLGRTTDFPHWDNLPGHEDRKSVV